MTVTLVSSMEELADLNADPEEVELHVLDPTYDSPPGRWIPAGKNIGESVPTDTLGESGFVIYADETIDYWALRCHLSLVRRSVGPVASWGTPFEDERFGIPSRLSSRPC